MDHNRVTLIGRLTHNPNYFPPGRRGQEHCTGVLAINRVVPSEAGAEADYIPFSIWGTEARQFVESRQKGDECCLLGRLRTNFVLQANGQSRYLWEVRVDVVKYGRQSLNNLHAPPREETRVTRALETLTAEFGDER